VGDPATEEGRALLKDRSPALHADKIKTPLMIVQGAYDSSEQRSDVEKIAASLRDRGIPVEYLLAPDEGHVFAKPVNNMAMFMAVEKFFSKYLGGRYQQDATPEVVARLTAITVDPKTLSGEHTSKGSQ
jgi:dipeptidyl aminopeptidase/acylaminoacyl peptidase